MTNCNHTPDNDGHCHNCGKIINFDYHEVSGCPCQTLGFKNLAADLRAKGHLKNPHAVALGRKGGEVSGGKKAEASKRNLTNVSQESRLANAAKARAALAAKRLAAKTLQEIPELEPDKAICSHCKGFFQPDNGATICFYCVTDPNW
jgi:Zn finger protein HypA/HybF involved in hydrogenase expression